MQAGDSVTCEPKQLLLERDNQGGIPEGLNHAKKPMSQQQRGEPIRIQSSPVP
jgi:hypothetical protein